jgi:excisionase family DNA binding protein
MKVKDYLERKFSVDEAAKMLSLHPMTVRRKLADNTLGYYKSGGKIFIGESHLVDFWKRSERKPRQQTQT